MNVLGGKFLVCAGVFFTHDNMNVSKAIVCISRAGIMCGASLYILCSKENWLMFD